MVYKEKSFVILGFFLVYYVFAIPALNCHSIIDIYKGAALDDGILVEQYMFFVMAYLPLLLFHSYEGYMKSQASYIVIRTQERKTLFHTFIRKMVFRCLQLEGLRLCAYGIILLLHSSLSFTGLADFGKMFFFNLCVDITLMMIQLMIEVFFNGKTALFLMLIYIILSILTAGKIAAYHPQLLLLALPNLAVTQRLQASNLPMPFIILVCCILFALLYACGRKWIRKKDIL